MVAAKDLIRVLLPAWERKGIFQELILFLILLTSALKLEFLFLLIVKGFPRYLSSLSNNLISRAEAIHLHLFFFLVSPLTKIKNRFMIMSKLP